MKRKIIGIFVCTLLIVIGVFSGTGSINNDENNMDADDFAKSSDEQLKGIMKDGGGVYAPSATDAQIEAAIISGVAWLATQQETSTGDPLYGSWGDPAETTHQTAFTCFVLIKLQDYAYETASPLTWDGPFDPDYTYHDNVIAGWEYIFTQDTLINGKYVRTQPIVPQEHPPNSQNWDDPDTNSNGIGIYLGAGDETPADPYQGKVYYTGIFLMALVASGDPTHVNEGNINFDNSGGADTFGEIAQEVVDWLAFAQSDYGNGEGGYSYRALDNAEWISYTTQPDNSISGYAYLGLQAAEAIIPRLGAQAFACTVPGWVKTELNFWIDYIQCKTPGTKHGGSGYSGFQGPCSGVNELKTGNLIFEMTYYGDGSGVPRFDDALAYIERHWQDLSLDPGWGYALGSPACYQAMFCLMKGLQYSGINLLDTDNDPAATPNVDWWNQNPSGQPPYDDFCSVLVDQQDTNPGFFEGSWPKGCWSDDGRILSTTWALFVLERIPKYQGPDLFKWDDIEDCVKPCEYINYTITVINPAEHDLHNVVVYDKLPADTYFVEAGSLSPPGIPGIYDSSTNLIKWDIGTMTPSMTVDLYLRVLVRPDVTPGIIIYNVAYVTSDEAATVYVTQDTPVCCCPDIEILGGIGVTAIIKNTMCPDMVNLPWWINIKGGRQGQIDTTISGVIASLPISQSETIKSGFFIGFGPITITVTVDDCPPVKKCAFILGFFVIIPKEKEPTIEEKFNGCRSCI